MLPDDQDDFDDLYYSLLDGHGPTLGLADLQARREEIIALCAEHDSTNVRLFGDILHQPLPPRDEIGILVDFDFATGRALSYGALWSELVELLHHRVDLTRPAEAEEQHRDLGDTLPL